MMYNVQEMLTYCSFKEFSTSTKEQSVPSEDGLIIILGDIIAYVSRGVARGEQASDVQSAHLDLVTLTHLLCDPLNPVITTKDNQSWHLQILV